MCIELNVHTYPGVSYRLHKSYIEENSVYHRSISILIDLKIVLVHMCSKMETEKIISDYSGHEITTMLFKIYF